MMLVLVLIAFAAIAAFDLPSLIKNKMRREVITYSIVFLLVLALGILWALDAKVPSPIKAWQDLYQSLHITFKPESTAPSPIQPSGRY